MSIALDTPAHGPYVAKQQCSAKSKSTGERCLRPVVPGATICRHHGGNAPQVKRKARERLEKLVDPSIQFLADLIDQGIASEDKSVVLKAALGILDRCGYGPKSQIELSRPENSNPVSPDGQEFRWEDFSVETRRMMLRDMERAAQKRLAVQGVQVEAEDETDNPIDVSYEEVET